MAIIPRRMRSVTVHRVFCSSLLRVRTILIFDALAITFLAMLVAVLLLLFIMPEARSMGLITISEDINERIPFIVGIVCGALLLTVTTSAYPVFYITSRPPTFSINGSFGNTKKGHGIRCLLLGMQFVMSISLIIFTAFIYLQYEYMINHDMGINRKNLLSVDVSVASSRISDFMQRKQLAEELKRNPMIADVTFASSQFVLPQRMGWTRSEMSFEVYPVDWNFLDFMGIEVYGGDNFTEAAQSALDGTIIFSETAQKVYALTLDSRMLGHTDKPTQIAGFCRDVLFRSLQYGISPFAFYVFGRTSMASWDNMSRMYIRTVDNADMSALSDYIRNCVADVSQDINPSFVHVPLFDEELQLVYSSEKRMSQLLTFFPLVSIIITLLGVFGLVLLDVQYRRREIAIRRINGALVGDVLGLFKSRILK